MESEECVKRRTELNNELNNYKRKWNILEANRQFWISIGTRLKRGQKKSKKTFTYHLRYTTIFVTLASAFMILPLTIPIGICLYIKTLYHIIKMAVCGYCYVKLKKGVIATDKIEGKYTNKKNEIEENEEKIYRQIDEIEKLTITPPSIITKCIERNSLNQTEIEDLSL